MNRTDYYSIDQVPALRTGVISAARPRQAGMVIGVVPRYDPHGMGLPLAPLPGVVGVDIGGISGHGGGGGVGVGVGVGVPAGGRQRAATASSLDRPREVGHRCCCPRTNLRPVLPSFFSIHTVRTVLRVYFCLT